MNAVTHLDVSTLYSVHVRDLTIPVSIGVYDFERKQAQPLVLSVCLILRRKAELRDNIAEVQDYDVIRRTALLLARRQHFDLQETFCIAMLEACIEEPSVVAAIVRTEKSTIYPDAKGVGCTMAKIKDASLETLPAWLVNL
jgi:7,8-dihydroneopterin aldolase/epimerase/oxygenase